MDNDIIIEILPDGRYAITKDDWEKSQQTWKDSIKEATRQARRDALEEAARICEGFYFKSARIHDGGTIDDCAEAIRQRAKEYDNEET